MTPRGEEQRRLTPGRTAAFAVVVVVGVLLFPLATRRRRTDVDG